LSTSDILYTAALTINFQIADFLDDNSSTLSEADKQNIKSALDVLGDIINWNAAYFEEVEKYFTQNQPQ